ncbi:MAG: hypothetical protein WBO95_04765 [Candidatus Dechloromonas phosphoritropha]|jgi:hypothetical protein
MGTEQQKSALELTVFGEFAAKANIEIDPESVSKPGAESEPDIFCTLRSGELVAYELVEICSEGIASTIAKIRKDDAETGAFFVSDPTEKTLRQKLNKTYRTSRPIELLCYTNGRTVSDDEQIVFQTRQWANAIKGPFRKIWLLGENGVYEVWQVV